MEHRCQMLIPGNGLPCRHYIRPEKPETPGFCQQPTQFFCTEAMKRKLPAISYSRLNDFIHCRRRYYHGVVQGLNVKPEHLPEAIKLGRVLDAFIRSRHDGTDYQPEIEALQLTPIQAAKMSGLMRAHKDLAVVINTTDLLGCQYKIHAPIGQNQIIGVVDRAYEECIKETKLSSRPDFYTQKENIAYQLGTYFLGNEAWEYADVEITRVPSLKTGQGRYSDETPEDYEERIYGDIISRPAYYFQGWDRNTKTYGVRLWRSEFDLDEIFATYVHVLREIQRTVKEDSWYPNNLACHVPAPCPFLPIKRSGVISEEIFDKRQMEGG